MIHETVRAENRKQKQKAEKKLFLLTIGDSSAPQVSE